MRYWLVLSLLFAGLAVAGSKIYKTVDENGNVVYTDQPPEDNPQAMDLPEISVMESAPKVKGKTALDRVRERQEEQEKEQSGTGFSNFTIVEPQPDQTYWGTGGSMAVTLGIDGQLSEGQRFRFTVDGREVGTSTSPRLVLTDIFRGTHRVQADVVDASGKSLASAGPVTFHMKQQSRQNPNSPTSRNSNNQPSPAQVNRAQRRALNNNRSGGG